MNTSQMRVALEKKYNKAFVTKMKDNQVTATYLRLKRNNQI